MSFLGVLRSSLKLALGIGFLMALFFLGALFWTEEVDADLCHIRTDGEGLIPLHDQFGPEVYCDLKWGMVLFFLTFGTVRALPVSIPVALVLVLARTIYLRVRNSEALR